MLSSILIATNQRVVVAQRQQRGLVALTIRGAILFYSSAIWRSDFHSVKIFVFVFVFLFCFFFCKILNSHSLA